MRIDVGYVLGVLGEFVLFIYFANTSFWPKKSYWISSLAAALGYALLFGVGLLGNPPLSVASFFVINGILFNRFYHVRIRGAIFYSLVLDTLSAAGEYIILYISGLDFSILPIQVTPQQSLAITIGGKFIYLIGIIFLKKTIKQAGRQKNDSLIMLSSVPFATLVSLTAIMFIDMDYRIFFMICMMLIFINAVVFAVNETLNKKNGELSMLQQELSEYELIAEKYKNTEIMRHDFKKQLNVLNGLIDSGNEQAGKYLSMLEQSQRDLNYMTYTDNTVLNMLLAQKIQECHEHGVEIHIHSTNPDFNFISETDIVAVFSNLIDNAIEASETSSEKVIFVDLYTVNRIYSAVKVENSADKAPIILDGALRTQKTENGIHGLGIKSINHALKKYGSKLSWTYDKENRFFRAVVLIRVKE